MNNSRGANLAIMSDPVEGLISITNGTGSTIQKIIERECTDRMLKMRSGVTPGYVEQNSTRTGAPYPGGRRRTAQGRVHLTSGGRKRTEQHRFVANVLELELGVRNRVCATTVRLAWASARRGSGDGSAVCCFSDNLGLYRIGFQ